MFVVFLNKTITLLNFFIMYYQLFVTIRETQKQAQFSCDSFEEVQEVIAKKMPKHCKIEYYDCSGLVGTAEKYYNVSQDTYITYRKTKV